MKMKKHKTEKIKQPKYICIKFLIDLIIFA